MNKAFVKESDESDDDLDLEQPPGVPPGTKNYITPAGHQRLRDELLHLLDVERPDVVKLLSWAASNGDRSENGDYIYGKRRLREIYRCNKFLSLALSIAVVVRASEQPKDEVLFGAKVTIEDENEKKFSYHIVGEDEIDMD